MSSRKNAVGVAFPCIPTCAAPLKRLGRPPSPWTGHPIRARSALQANSVVNWFAALFHDLGYESCSSHSGRRSFITLAARNIHRSGCSLHDVQMLAGHRSIETTERYIDGDTCAQRRLVAYV